MKLASKGGDVGLEVAKAEMAAELTRLVSMGYMKAIIFAFATT